jgi:hypothetical protein
VISPLVEVTLPELLEANKVPPGIGVKKSGGPLTPGARTVAEADERLSNMAIADRNDNERSEVFFIGEPG